MDNFEKKYAKFDEVVSLVQQAVKEPENSGNTMTTLNSANCMTKMKMVP